MSTIQNQLKNTQTQLNQLQSRVNSLQSTITPAWPVITKFHFRSLLTPVQELVWDNYDILKDTLGLTNEQYMQLRTFRARFDSAEKVTMDDEYLVQGLNALAAWGLVYSGQPVFTAEDVTNILSGGQTDNEPEENI